MAKTTKNPLSDLPIEQIHSELAKRQRIRSELAKYRKRVREIWKTRKNLQLRIGRLDAKLVRLAKTLKNN